MLRIIGSPLVPSPTRIRVIIDSSRYYSSEKQGVITRALSNTVMLLPLNSLVIAMPTVHIIMVYV